MQSNILDKLITSSQDYAISEYDYVIDVPLVDNDFQEINQEIKDEIVTVIEIPEEKLLTIEVSDESMIPTAIMFSLRDHFYIKKMVVLSKDVQGWEFLYSFFLSGHIDYITFQEVT